MVVIEGTADRSVVSVYPDLVLCVLWSESVTIISAPPGDAIPGAVGQ